MPDDDLDATLSTLHGQIGQSPLAQLGPLGQFGAAISPPFFQGLQDQQTAKFQQQVQLLGVKNRIQQQRMEKTRLLITIADKMLKSPDQVTRDFGAKTKGDVLKQLGLNPSPAVLGGFANRSVSEPDLKRAGRYLDLPGMTEQRVSELSGVPLQAVHELAQGRGSEAYSHIVYGKSLAQRKEESLKLEKSTYDLWKAKHPLAPAAESEASLLSYERFGKDLPDLSDDDRVTIARLAQHRLLEREQQKEARKFSHETELAKVKANLAQLKTNIENQQVATLSVHGYRLLDRKGNEYDGDPLALSGDVMRRGFEAVDKQTVKDLRMGKQSFRIFGNMRAQAAVLAQKGLLAKTAALYETAARSSPDYAAAQGGDPRALERLATYVAFNIGKFTKDPDVLTWAGMESEMIISLRNLGEKGVRAMQGFAGAVGVMKGGQYDAVDRYIRNLELITVAQFDKKWEGAFETRYIGRHRKSGQTGTLTLRPGEALDLGQYQITPEFGGPAR